MDILAILCICAVAVMFKLTTPEDRNRWWWNAVAGLLLFGAIGLVVTLITTGTVSAPSGDHSR